MTFDRIREIATANNLSVISAPVAGANSPVSVDVERAADRTFVVEAAFDVNVPASIAWEVLTVGRAWIGSVPMHVVLDVREHDRRVLEFRDLSGRDCSVYEGAWEIRNAGGVTRVNFRLRAEPIGWQPAALVARAIRRNVTRLLDEVRDEILGRAAR
jgi:hypothetical protein